MAGGHHPHLDREGGTGTFLRSPTGLALLGFLPIARSSLMTEHPAPLFSVLPSGVLFLDPLLHRLMPGGHGGLGEPGKTADHRGHPNDRADGGQQ